MGRGAERYFLEAVGRSVRLARVRDGMRRATQDLNVRAFILQKDEGRVCSK